MRWGSAETFDDHRNDLLRFSFLFCFRWRFKFKSGFVGRVVRDVHLRVCLRESIRQFGMFGVFVEELGEGRGLRR
jgi:hypothetical protein